MNKPPLVFYTDDDMDDQYMFVEAVKQINKEIRVSLQPDGDNLVQDLKNSDVLPDVVFLDINMPRKNGFQALEEIRKDKSDTELPVIMFSNADDPAVAEKSKKLGANLFITKPSQYDAFYRLLTNVLNLDLKSLQHTASNFYFNQPAP